MDQSQLIIIVIIMITIIIIIYIAQFDINGFLTAVSSQNVCVVLFVSVFVCLLIYLCQTADKCWNLECGIKVAVRLMCVLMSECYA